MRQNNSCHNRFFSTCIPAAPRPRPSILRINKRLPCRSFQKADSIPAASLAPAEAALPQNDQDHREDVIGEIISSSSSISSPPQQTNSSSFSTSAISYQQDTVLTTFRWPKALGGHQISVIGSFNGWTTPVPLFSSATGDFMRSLSLPANQHHIQFKFLVDGQHAVSICEPTIMDANGLWNNHRFVTPTATFTWNSPQLGGKEVLLAGDWTGWGELKPLHLDPETGCHSVKICLPPGEYNYQFLVDGEWMLTPDAPTVEEIDGSVSNVMTAKAPLSFQIFYATGWDSPTYINYRLVSGNDGNGGGGDGNEASTGWSKLPMHVTHSRAKPKGGQWLAATIFAELPKIKGSNNNISSAQQVLEFYMSNGQGKEDRPGGGGSGRIYKCLNYGGYKLSSGCIKPFDRSQKPATMLVADLDGTIVGDDEAADAATAHFNNYWEGVASLSGSFLVYNTGRSQGQFTGLLESKAEILPIPDALITAVGTKVFLLDTEGGSRATASGMVWQEDAAWAESLDEGWNLGAARSAAQAVIEELKSRSIVDANGNGAAHWLDDGSEHPHRVALSVRADMLNRAKDVLKAELAKSGVDAQLITSGLGEWRYLDCVAKNAGKLNALEHVRQVFGIAQDQCMSAGDSGNDILMLGGKGPACIVGNAQPELLNWALTQPQTGRIVVADSHLADGVVEGLARHGLY